MALVLLAIPGVTIAVVSIAAFAGQWLWWLDVLANFRAQYLVALLVLGVLLMVSGWRRTGYGVLAVAAVNLVFVGPLYFGFPAKGDPGALSIRVLSFNLLSTNESYSDVIEYIEATDPDVVLLHEASRPWEVAMESADWDYEAIRPRSDQLIFGTLVLLRADEREVVSFGFAETEPRAVMIDYRPRGWPEPISILSTHPLAPTDEERSKLRDAQLAFAGKWASEQEGAYVVVGDFNATPWSHPFRDMLDVSGLKNSQIGFGLQPSFPTGSAFLLRVPIDHLLYSEALLVTDRRLGPDLGSDHFPLVVDVQLGS